ncbi:MAG: helix-turn-helix domain-containing protein [Candidatus Kaiserbacteria bacterium]|nr:helix-turn-helix domain-containing protein [Candidatus Kaiserbacteria bacterium]
MKKEFNSALTSKLHKVGLSDKEAITYAYLLESGGAFPSTVAHETGLNRTTVYKVLTTLSVKGLVTEYEKRKKFFYQAENPQYLEKYADMQVSLAKEAKEKLGIIMPLLDGIYKSSSNKPVIRFFNGKEGILTIYEDHVSGESKYEMLAFSNTADLLPLVDGEFKQNYLKRKAQAGITTRAIVPFDSRTIEDEYSAFEKRLHLEMKHLAEGEFPFKADLTLYAKNKVSIINFNEPHFVGIIIEDETIYNMIKLFFELVWKEL